MCCATCFACCSDAKEKPPHGPDDGPHSHLNGAKHFATYAEYKAAKKALKAKRTVAEMLEL